MYSFPYFTLFDIVPQLCQLYYIIVLFCYQIYLRGCFWGCFGWKCDDVTMWVLESHIFKRRKCVIFGQSCDRVRFEDKPLKTRRYVVYGILCDDVTLFFIYSFVNVWDDGTMGPCFIYFSVLTVFMPYLGSFWLTFNVWLRRLSFALATKGGFEDVMHLLSVLLLCYQCQ